MSAVAATSVPGRKLHPLVRLVDVMASVAAYTADDDEYDEDYRFDSVDPDEHLFRAGSEVDGNKNPKGYIERYRPQERSRLLIHQIKQILAANEEYLPLTIRQVFYRMVAEHGYPKDADTALYDVMKNMRRARIIPFDCIRDDGIGRFEEVQHDGPADFWRSVGEWRKEYKRDRQEGQPFRVEIWCEAAGMAPRHGWPRSSMTRSCPGSTRRRTRRFCGKRRPSGTGSPWRSCRRDRHRLRCLWSSTGRAQQTRPLQPLREGPHALAEIQSQAQREPRLPS
jgi:hypothetical protein